MRQQMAKDLDALETKLLHQRTNLNLSIGWVDFKVKFISSIVLLSHYVIIYVIIYVMHIFIVWLEEK